MKRRCPNCDQFFKEGQEIRGVFFSYWHELPSKRVVCVSKPHDSIPETYVHRNCLEANEDLAEVTGEN